MPSARAFISISGKVQGVGFRARVARLAQKLGITGLVRNAANGTVEAFCEAQAKTQISELARELENPHQSGLLPPSSPEKVQVFFEGQPGFKQAWKKFQGFEIDYAEG